MENFLTLWRKIWVFILGALVYLVGEYFRGVWFQDFHFNPCKFATDQNGTFCNSPFSQTLGWPLIYVGVAFLVIAVILVFANSAGYRKWLRLSYWYVPFAAIIIFALFPAHFFQSEIGRDTVTRDLGVLYVLITLGVVFYFHSK